MALLDHFAPTLDLSTLDKATGKHQQVCSCTGARIVQPSYYCIFSHEQRLKMDSAVKLPGSGLQESASQVASFLQLAESVAGTARGSAFHTHVQQRKIPLRLAQYIQSSFSEAAPDSGSASDAGSGVLQPFKPGSQPWKTALDLPGVPLALQLLTALVKQQEVRSASPVPMITLSHGAQA